MVTQEPKQAVRSCEPGYAGLPGARVHPEAPSPTPRPRASEKGYEWKRLGLTLGAQLIAGVSTVMHVDSPTFGVGTEIDLEDDLGLDDSRLMGRIDINWRMARKHELDFSLFRISRDGSRMLDRDIQIGDVVFPINTQVTSESELTVIKLAYRYAFLHRPRWHVGTSVGAHTMGWNTKVEAGSLARARDFDFFAPLPVLGIFGSYAITPRLYLNASSEFFGLEFEGFDGFLNDTRLNLEHRTFEHLGFGLGLEYFLLSASVDGKRGNLTAEMDYDYYGLVGFVRIF